MTEEDGYCMLLAFFSYPSFHSSLFIVLYSYVFFFFYIYIFGTEQQAGGHDIVDMVEGDA